jgi:hypothetical protein
MTGQQRLPSMSDTLMMEVLFIVVCTDSRGAAVVARGMSRELQNFDRASRLIR